MKLNELLDLFDRGAPVIGAEEIMRRLTNDAMRITAKLNNAYYTQKEIRSSGGTEEFAV
jgi:hypothetical protein